MKENVKIYKLSVSNNWQESWFISQYGQKLFDSLKKEALAVSKGRCIGCGHEPPDNRKGDCLFFHIYDVKKSRPELTKGVMLCKACHSTQHIENAIKNKWVIFVNSIYDQENLIRLSRANQIHGALAQRTIVKLKKTPEQFLKDWESGVIKITPTLKVIFTNNFNIDDLY